MLWHQGMGGRFYDYLESDEYVANADRAIKAYFRSEEHTSELQSLTNLVCRLLLEKKKKHQTNQTSATNTRRTPQESGNGDNTRKQHNRQSDP